MGIGDLPREIRSRVTYELRHWAHKRVKRMTPRNLKMICATATWRASKVAPILETRAVAHVPMFAPRMRGIAPAR